MLKKILMASAFTVALLSAPAQAQTTAPEALYSAPPVNPFLNWCMNGDRYRFAVKLTVPAGQSFDLTSVKLPLWFEETNPATAIDVQVLKWTEDATEPTAADVLATLSMVETLPPPQDTGVGDSERREYNFVPSQPLRLQSGSSFWVKFASTTTIGGCDVYTSTSALPTGGAFVRAAEYQGDNASWLDRTDGPVTELVVMGTPVVNVDPPVVVPTVPTPVPGLTGLALPLLSLSFAGLGLWAQRRRSSR